MNNNILEIIKGYNEEKRILTLSLKEDLKISTLSNIENRLNIIDDNIKNLINDDIITYGVNKD